MPVGQYCHPIEIFLGASFHPGGGGYGREEGCGISDGNYYLVAYSTNTIIIMSSQDLGNLTSCAPSPFSFSGSILIVAVFSIISVLTILGNGLVIWIVLTTKRMRTVTNYFLVNLSVGDMLSVFQIIPNVYYVILSDWAFGLGYCRFSQFFTAFGIALSVLTFTGLTADRSVCLPFSFSCHNSRCFKAYTLGVMVDQLDLIFKIPQKQAVLYCFNSAIPSLSLRVGNNLTDACTEIMLNI